MSSRGACPGPDQTVSGVPGSGDLGPSADGDIGGDAFQFVDSEAAGGLTAGTPALSANRHRRRKKKSSWPLIAGGIGVVAIIAGSAVALRSGGAQPETDTRQAPAVNEEWEKQEAEMIASSENLTPWKRS